MLHDYINGYNVAELPCCEVGEFHGATIQRSLKEYDEAPDNKKELYCINCVFAETELNGADEKNLDSGFPVISKDENEKFLQKYGPYVKHLISEYSEYGGDAMLQGDGVRIGLGIFILNEAAFNWVCQQTEMVGIPTSLMLNIRDAMRGKRNFYQKLIAEGFTNVLFVTETRGFESDNETPVEASNYLDEDIGEMINAMAENSEGQTLAIITCTVNSLLHGPDVTEIGNIDTCGRIQETSDCIADPVCDAVDPEFEDNAFMKIIKAETLYGFKVEHFLAILTAHVMFESSVWDKVDAHL